MTNDGLTRDAFLGGRLELWQPVKGYRAGVDPVLLAATIPARSGDRILDLGCGVGAAIYCLSARVAGVRVTGVELQEEYAKLARLNAELGGYSADIVTADISQLPTSLRQMQFNHVLANPPYFDRSAGQGSPDSGRETAMGQDTPLRVWCEVATRRVAPGGTVTFIHRVEMLRELLSCLDPSLGSVRVWPITAREKRNATRVLVRASKGGRAPFRLHASLVLHEGTTHIADGDSYRPEIRDVLRNAAALPFPE